MSGPGNKPRSGAVGWFVLQVAEHDLDKAACGGICLAPPIGGVGVKFKVASSGSWNANSSVRLASTPGSATSLPTQGNG